MGPGDEDMEMYWDDLEQWELDRLAEDREYDEDYEEYDDEE